MTDNIDDLLEMVRARLGQDRFREALRGLLEQEDQRKRTAQSDARVVCTGVDDKKPDGGEVSLFDDFDIDFNKYAYLTDYAVGTDKGGVSPIVANYMMQMEDFGGVG